MSRTPSTYQDAKEALRWAEDRRIEGNPAREISTLKLLAFTVNNLLKTAQAEVRAAAKGKARG